jgi:HEPN domain-containing protein
MKEQDFALDWLNTAESDLVNSQKFFNLSVFDWCLLASQQAAEKALKAVCIVNGKGLQKMHDLSVLSKKVNAPDEIIKKASFLNPFYTTARYPDKQMHLLIENKETASKAIAASKEVVMWCKTIILK